MILHDCKSRIGNLEQTISECDNFPPRVVIDKRINQCGRDFIEFLIAVF